MTTTYQEVGHLDDGYNLPDLRRSCYSLPFREGDGADQQPNGTPRSGKRPPSAGGVLILACPSTLSGITMGLSFASYISLALAVLVSTALGIAIGIWVRGLRE